MNRRGIEGIQDTKYIGMTLTELLTFLGYFYASWPRRNYLVKRTPLVTALTLDSDQTPSDNAGRRLRRDVTRG